MIAPIGTKRIGGKVQADTKAGFTFMVTVNMLSSEIVAPFVVYNGTKLIDTQHPERTLAHKYKDWRGSAPGRTAHMAFQKKHWFDKYITIEYLDFILDVVYPGLKVGISWDMAPAHTDAIVGAYRTEDRRRLIGPWVHQWWPIFSPPSL